MKDLPSPKSDLFRNATYVCDGIVAALGGLGLLGWISGLRVLASINPNYIPMAPDTAVLFIAFGSILPFNAARPLSRRSRTFLCVVVALASMYGLLKSIGYAARLDLTFENILFPVTEKLGSFPLARMSPITGTLFLLSGTALLLILWNNPNSFTRNLAGGIGILICITGYVATTGYLFGSPLFYGGDIIPLAATTAIAFLMLGAGLIAAAGRDGVFVRPFVGPSIRARMLRAFLPLTVAAVLITDYLNDKLDNFAAVNHSLLSATFSLVFAMAATAAVVYVARSVSQAVDRAETERQRAEDELAQERNLLRTVIDNLPDQIFAKDAAGKYILNNQSHARMVGTTPEAMLGKTDYDFYSPAAAARHRADDRTVIQSGKAVPDYEDILPDQSGQAHWVLTTKVPLRDGGGQIAGSVGINRDISKWKRAEEGLASLAAIIESSDDAIYRKTLDGIVTSWNRGAEKIYGYSAEEIIGRSIAIIVPPDRTDELAQIMEKICRREYVRHFDTVRVRKNGVSIDVAVTISPIEDANGKIIGASVIARDNTERKQAEKALLQAEEKYRAIFDYAVEGIFQSTPEGRFITANAALARMLGYATPQELLSTITDIAQQVYADPSARAELRRLMEEQTEVQGFEFQVRRKDGSLMWVSENARAVRDINGALLYYEGTTQNITDRKQTEKELQYLSTHDALTGLYNRAFFEAELARLDHGRHFPVSVVMADLNGLKRINDSLGHAAGDELLRQAAQVLETVFRAEDVVARIGGDEFAVLLPNADATGAADALARIRKCLVTENSRRQNLPLSFALGAASANGHGPLMQAMEEADGQMYLDKSAQVKSKNGTDV